MRVFTVAAMVEEASLAQISQLTRNRADGAPFVPPMTVIGWPPICPRYYTDLSEAAS